MNSLEIQRKRKVTEKDKTKRKERKAKEVNMPLKKLIENYKMIKKFSNQREITAQHIDNAGAR